MLFTLAVTLFLLSILFNLATCLFPLEVHCKHTALPPIRYLTVRWPTTTPAYKRYEVRIAQPRDSSSLSVVETEVHEVPKGDNLGQENVQAWFEAVVPVLKEGPVEVSVWGELRGGWVLLSIVTPVNACRQYRL